MKMSIWLFPKMFKIAEITPNNFFYDHKGKWHFLCNQIASKVDFLFARDLMWSGSQETVSLQFQIESDEMRNHKN